MEPALVFLFAFLTEFCGLSYVLAVSHDKVVAVFVFNALNSALAHASLYLIVGDRDYALWSYLGEVVGMLPAWWLDKNKRLVGRWLAGRKYQIIQYVNRRRKVARRKPKLRRPKETNAGSDSGH